MKKALRKKRIKQRIKASFQKRRMLLRKGIEVLPHLFTLGNAFFGFSSVIFSANSEWIASAYCILLGALMDALDGRVARMVKATSDLGVQLDSLADAITFCFAPAFLIYSLYLDELGVLGVVVSSFFLFAGLLRLARFNLISSRQTLYFIGLPTTVAGCFLATMVLHMGDLERLSDFVFFFLFLICSLSVLMVSRVPFLAFKSKSFCLKKNWQKVVATVLFAFIATLRFNVVLLLFFGLYLIGSILYFGFHRFKKNNL